MPRVFRSMVRDGNRPLIAASRDALGVVPGAPPGGDIQVEAGMVQPKSGGLSVTRSWKDLPPSRIPKRLRHLMPDARGSKKFCCWQLGEGEFAAGKVDDNLVLRVDSPTHGLIEPSHEMTIEELQHAIAATREKWSLIDEEHQL